MDAAIAKFMKDGVNPDDLARIKAQIAAAQIYGDDSVQGLARRYGAAMSIGLSVKDIKDWPDILQSITPEEVMAAAHEVLDPKRSVTGWLSAKEQAQ